MPPSFSTPGLQHGCTVFAQLVGIGPAETAAACFVPARSRRPGAAVAPCSVCGSRGLACVAPAPDTAASHAVHTTIVSQRHATLGTLQLTRALPSSNIARLTCSIAALPSASIASMSVRRLETTDSALSDSSSPCRSLRFALRACHGARGEGAQRRPVRPQHTGAGYAKSAPRGVCTPLAAVRRARRGVR